MRITIFTSENCLITGSWHKTNIAIKCCFVVTIISVLLQIIEIQIPHIYTLEIFHQFELSFLYFFFLTWVSYIGFLCGSVGKESARNVEDLGLIPGLGRSLGEGKGYSLQYSGLENSMDCIVYGAAESDMIE